MNIEAMALSALRAAGIEAFADVPKDRPDEFATVEALGGQTSAGGWLAHPGVAVQAWAATRYRASELIERCRAAMGALADDPRVLSIEANPPYLFRSEEGIPRYQATFDFTIHNR